MGAVVVDGIADPDPVLAKAAEYATVPPTLRATLLADRLRDWPGAGGVPSGEGEAATTSLDVNVRIRRLNDQLRTSLSLRHGIVALSRAVDALDGAARDRVLTDRKSTRLNSSH